MGYITNCLGACFENRNSALFPRGIEHKSEKKILLLFLCKENPVIYA